MYGDFLNKQIKELNQIYYQAEKIKELEDKIKNLQKEIKKFVKGEEVLIFMTKQTNVRFDKGGIALSKDQSLKY